MTTQSSDEVEVKFLVHDVEALVHSLIDKGFHQKTPSTFESNTLYDNASGDLHSSGEVLRLRVYCDKWRLTHKTRGIESKYKIRVEHETYVSNGDEMHAILAALGYSPSLCYEKYRSEWSDGTGEVVIDHTPIGDLAEIEGPPDWIDHIAKAINLSESDYITASYAELFSQWKQRTASLAQNMTFDECGIPRPSDPTPV